MPKNKEKPKKGKKGSPGKPKAAKATTKKKSAAAASKGAAKKPLFKTMVQKLKTAPASYVPPTRQRLMDDLLDSTTARAHTCSLRGTDSSMLLWLG